MIRFKASDVALSPIGDMVAVTRQFGVGPNVSGSRGEGWPQRTTKMPFRQKKKRKCSQSFLETEGVFHSAVTYLLVMQQNHLRLMADARQMRDSCAALEPELIWIDSITTQAFTEGQKGETQEGGTGRKLEYP